MSGGRDWTKEEDSILIEYYPLYGSQKVSEEIKNQLKFERNNISVKNRARKLNIVKEDRYHDDWIYNNYKNYSTYSQLWVEYNKHFGTNMSSSSFRVHMRRIGLKTGRQTFVDMIDEMFDEISEIYINNGVTKTQEAIFNKTGILSPNSAIYDYMYKHGIKVRDSAHAKNASVQRSVPIGTIGFHKTSDGTTMAKVKTLDGWKDYGEYICGKKEGYVAIPLDKNRNNLSPENWVQVPIKYNGKMSKYNLRSENPEVTKAGILWCDLDETMRSQGIDTAALIKSMEDLETI